MSRQTTYHCDLCKGEIEDNNSGYGFLPHKIDIPYQSVVPCVFGALEHYSTHICVACIHEIANVAAILREGGTNHDSDK